MSMLSVGRGRPGCVGAGVGEEDKAETSLTCSLLPLLNAHLSCSFLLLRICTCVDGLMPAGTLRAGPPS